MDILGIRKKGRTRRRLRLPWALALVTAGLVASPEICRPCLALNMPPLGDARSKRHTSNFQAKQNHPTSYDGSSSFRGPIVFGRGNNTSDARERISHFYQDGHNELVLPGKSPRPLKESASTKNMLKIIVDHLAYQNAPIDVKEVAESVEFYLRTRKRLLGSAKAFGAGLSNGQKIPPIITVYDLCSGHGLTGMLFAACNPGVRTVLVDRSEPPSHKILRNCLAEVCPWIGTSSDRAGSDNNIIQFAPASLETFREEFHSAKGGQYDDSESTVAPGTSIVMSTHACGSLTDQVLEYAVDARAAGVAVMPCCYTGTDKGVPYGIKRALGVAWSADIRRSFYLQEHGYHSDFATIPSEITPMNRILVGERRGL